MIFKLLLDFVLLIVNVFLNTCRHDRVTQYSDTDYIYKVTTYLSYDTSSVVSMSLLQADVQRITLRRCADNKDV